jgi:GTPase SAR1 family protein
MKNTDIALIVYDITNRKSFEKLNFWINLVKEIEI